VDSSDEIMRRNIRPVFLPLVAHKLVACNVGYIAAAKTGDAEIPFRTPYRLGLYFAAGFDRPD
jgi:hypothetical protein